MAIKIMMTDSEVKLLTETVKLLSPNDIVFELGTAFGGSAAAMAEANPNVKIYTVDLHNSRGEDSISIDRTYQDVKDALSEFKNITTLCGNALYDFKDWDIEFDLYLEDGAHKDPALVNNLNRWSKFLKPSGLLLMHDNNKYCPDVGKNINILVDSGKFKKVKQIGSLTLLKKL